MSLALLERGDRSALAELYARHSGPLYRFALRMSGSSSLADDVVQEVFLTLIRGGHGYRSEAGPLGPYLFGMARNLVRTTLRRAAAVNDLEEEYPAPDDESDPLSGLARAERVERIRQAVLTLPLVYREVVVLCDLEEMSYDAAAEHLGCAVGTIRSRLHRGRHLLLGKLQETRCVT